MTSIAKMFSKARGRQSKIFSTPERITPAPKPVKKAVSTVGSEFRRSLLLEGTPGEKEVERDVVRKKLFGG